MIKSSLSLINVNLYQVLVMQEKENPSILGNIPDLLYACFTQLY